MPDDETWNTYRMTELAAAIAASGPRALEVLSEAIRIEDEEVRNYRVLRILAHLSVRLFNAGYETGATEVGAQAIQVGLGQGNEARFNLGDPVGSDEGPLADDWQWDD